MAPEKGPQWSEKLWLATVRMCVGYESLRSLARSLNGWDGLQDERGRLVLAQPDLFYLATSFARLPSYAMQQKKRPKANSFPLHVNQSNLQTLSCPRKKHLNVVVSKRVKELGLKITSIKLNLKKYDGKNPHVSQNKIVHLRDINVFIA